MATAVVDLDLDAVEADARQRIEALAGLAERLAPEALFDAEVAKELESIESEKRAAEMALRHVASARGELARRHAEAEAEAEAEARARALERVKEIDPKRLRAAAAVDAAARKFAFAVADLRATTQEENVELVKAGRGGVPVPGRTVYAGALVDAFESVGVPIRSVLEMDMIGVRRGPVGESVRPVDLADRERVPRRSQPAPSVERNTLRIGAASPRAAYKELLASGLGREQARAELGRSFGRQIDTGIPGRDDPWLLEAITAVERELEQENEKEA